MKKTELLPLALAFICFSSIPQTVQAGREPEDWDALPQIMTLVFGKSDLGLISIDNHRFVLNTQAGTIKEVSEADFKQRFPGPIPLPAAKVVNNTGIGSDIQLHTSGSLVVMAKNSYCSEGENITHQLSINDKSLTDFVRPCDSVSTIEEVGNQLWLGTRADGEYGDYPAEGIIIQSRDGKKKIGQISTKNGLTGDLVRIIRRNPADSKIWVATNQGINEISPTLKVEKAIYFYQDFDPGTGRPTVMLSSTPKKNPAIVELAKQLKLSDYKAFYAALKTIPPEAIDKLTNGLRGLYTPENALVGREAFAPAEVNKLVPFFIEASRSTDQSTKAVAFTALCATNDPKAIARFVELRSGQQSYGGFESYFIPKCLDKYAMFNLLPKDNNADLAQKLKADAKAALDAISGQRTDTFAPGQPMQVVVQNAISLNKMSDSSGMELINDYFKNSDGNDRDASFYEYVGQNMVYENGVTPAMLEGLQKFHTHDTARGCMYFDMRWNFMPKRFDATYAKAILAAVSHAVSPAYQAGHMRASPEFWKNVMETCTGAFKSQLDDPITKKTFMEKFYGTLSNADKALADQLARGQHPPIPAK